MTKVILAAVAFLFTTSSLSAAATWRPVGPPGGPVFDVDRSLSNPDVLMVAAEDGIYRSVDRGKTWVRSSGDLPRAEIIRIDPYDPDTAYASRHLPQGGGRIYKTEDAGMHWIAMGGLPEGIPIQARF